MAVEGVNNSNNNAGLYALGAAAIGGGAGAGVAYMTKPFLKDGAPTDSFVKKIEENAIAAMKEDERKYFIAMKKTVSDFESVKDMEGLKNFVKSDELIKEAAEAEKINIEEWVKTFDELGFENTKTMIDTNVIANARDSVQNFDNEVKSAFEESWDVNKGKFFHDEEKISLEGFNAVKKAARSIQGKYAMIYGAIAAGVLGIGTYLATMNMGKKSAPVPEQKIDAQA